jgi:hypothetical protein
MTSSHLQKLNYRTQMGHTVKGDIGGTSEWHEATWALPELQKSTEDIQL